MKPNQVLVVCSSNSFFGRILEKDFNCDGNRNLKTIFGDNPVYTFCNKENTFPSCPENNDRIYDFIWFAGCNTTGSIFSRFNNNGLEKISAILKLDGKIIFTESKNYVERYRPKLSKLSLTLQIEDLITHAIELGVSMPEVYIEQLTHFFCYNFRIINIDNHIIYQRKNTLYQQKYNKYKNKYLILKKLLNQEGSGEPPFRVLVIGGGNPELYGQGFFEVGGHHTSNFGAGQDWTNSQFWTDLETHLRDMKFEIIIIDQGSTSWLRETHDLLLRTSVKLLVPEGIFLLEGPFVHNNNTEIHDKMKEHNLNIVGRIGFGKVMDNNILTIYSPTNGRLLETIDSTDINGNITPGDWQSAGFILPNKDFKYVKEKNQIEFIKNRFLRM